MYEYLGNTEINLYNTLNIVGFLVLMLFNFSQLNKKKAFLGKISLEILSKQKEKKKQKVIIYFLSFFEIVIVTLLQYAFTENVNSLMSDITGTGMNYFGLLFFTPILIFVGCFLLGIDIFKQFDLITPAFPLALIFVKLGCFCAGCCAGIPCAFGIYNHNSGLVEFPVQLLEAGLALLIFIFLLFWRKKAKEGTLFPTYLIIYSGTRFFSEFLKDDPNILWKFKTYHILCLCGVVVGLIELFIVKKYKKFILKLEYKHIKLVIPYIKKVVLFFKKGMCALALKVKSRIRKFAVKHGIIREKNIVHHKKKKRKK